MSYWRTATPTQKYARSLEVACYILILPATIGLYLLYYAVFSGTVSSETGSYEEDLDGTIKSTVLYLAGLALMVFYAMSSRQLLAPTLEVLGWLLSILYNLIPIGFAIWIICYRTNGSSVQFLGVVVLLAILMWPTAVILMSARALWCFLKS